MKSVAALLFSLLALLPSAASADMTATFGAPGARVAAKIEIAANGDMRWSLGDRGYFLSLGEIDYIILPGPGGPRVMRLADYRAGIAQYNDRSEPQVERHLVAEGTVAVNGRSGTAFFVRPAATPNWPAVLVIDPDPALATLARAETRIFAMEGTGGLPAPMLAEMRAALAGGVSLRFLGHDLGAISTDPIPAERFVLPAEPLSPVPRPAVADAGAQPAADDAFKRAVFARGQLWLLTDGGQLRTIAENGTAADVAGLPGGPIDMCVKDGAPVVLTVAGGQWTAYRRDAGGWTALGHAATESEGFVALNCTHDRMSLVTDKRLITLVGDTAQVVTLSEPLSRAVMATTLDIGDAVLLGLDAGEWGGGLRRIARADGKVTILSRKPGGDGCAGPLSAACDPVNGIARAPGKPGCVVAAIGLVHMMPHGRLTEVCGGAIERLYFKPYTTEQHWTYDPKATEPFETVPFYGLVEAEGVLWAVGIDGLYRIDADGGIAFTKLPPFRDIGGVSVSFALPHLVLVRTSINRRVAVSGAVPILLAR